MDLDMPEGVQRMTEDELRRYRQTPIKREAVRARYVESRALWLLEYLSPRISPNIRLPDGTPARDAIGRLLAASGPTVPPAPFI